VLPDVFGMTDSRPESTEGMSKPGVGWRLTSGSLVMTGACLSSGEDRVVLYAINRDRVFWVGVLSRGSMLPRLK